MINHINKICCTHAESIYQTGITSNSLDTKSSIRLDFSFSDMEY
nr:MAG TPA: hypothetical protein [Caudoviricetes sp.]